MTTSEDRANSELLPFASKYKCVDKRYRFSERVPHRCQCVDYPISESGYQQDVGKRRTPRPEPWSPSTATQLTQKVLPDVVLLNIFKYIHPVDLVNGISKVSKRWNALAKAPSLYRYVRVLVNNQSPNSESTKKFLQGMRNHVRKLCVMYEKDVFFDVFPDCMPNVILLEILFLPDLSKSAQKLVECFPSVEILKFFYVYNINDCIIRTLFSSDSFKKLRQLCFISMGQKPLNFFRQGCETERTLLSGSIVDHSASSDMLSLGGRRNNSLRALLTSPIRNTLTELYITEYIKDSTYAIIGQLRNLTTLSIFSSLYGTDDELMQFKSLSKLEHLHLDCCGEDDFYMSSDGIAHFFELPSENAANYFPYRLKYLCFSHCQQFKLAAAKALVKSCPQLISLNVSRNYFMGEEALTVLVKNLRNLRFLDISEIEEMRCDALRNLSDDDMPQLQFLGVDHMMVSQEILSALNLKRPDLIISHKSDYCIKWYVQNGNPRLNKRFNGDLKSVLNDLAVFNGFCCMGECMRPYYPFAYEITLQ